MENEELNPDTDFKGGNRPGGQTPSGLPRGLGQSREPSRVPPHRRPVPRRTPHRDAAEVRDGGSGVHLGDRRRTMRSLRGQNDSSLSLNNQFRYIQQLFHIRPKIMIFLFYNTPKIFQKIP